MGNFFQRQAMAAPADLSDPLLKKWVKPSTNPFLVQVGMDALPQTCPSSSNRFQTGLYDNVSATSLLSMSDALWVQCCEAPLAHHPPTLSPPQRNAIHHYQYTQFSSDNCASDHMMHRKTARLRGPLQFPLRRLRLAVRTSSSEIPQRPGMQSGRRSPALTTPGHSTSLITPWPLDPRRTAWVVLAYTARRQWQGPGRMRAASTIKWCQNQRCVWVLTREVQPL
jgi:hypothetical protein